MDVFSPTSSSGVLVLLLMGVLICIAPAPAPATPQLPTDSSSSTSPQLGVVWTPPSPPDSALAALDRLAATGATAVRLTHLPPDTLATRADSLGLQLYVDLPISHVPAASLADTLSQVAPTLNRLLALATRHSSVAHVGLARIADTTVPVACRTLREWTNRVHEQAPSVQTYYVTPFPPAVDRCGDAVDRPLLDLRGHPRPDERWRAWAAHTEAVGIGALGTWTRPSASSGLQVPRSPERQARYLEEAFAQLLDSTRTAPPVLFVARWQDAAAPRLPSRRYGLHDGPGRSRPAAAVVRGVYSGTQRTFAFADGSPPARSHAPLLLGWGLVALLGGLYAGNLFVRQTVVRYFTAPGFYRDALRDGHDLSPAANGLLLVLVAAALGIAGARAAQLAAAHPGTEHVLRSLPNALQSTLAQGVGHPALAGLSVGGLALGLLLLWMGALIGAARLSARFSLAQGLVLVTWPCWPALLIVPVALAAGPNAPLSPWAFALLLLGGGGVALLLQTVRVLSDFWRVVDAPPWTVLLLFVLSPSALTSAAVLAAAYDGVPVRFLWRLAVHA
ncbi:MAG: hypothetical protein V5A58_06300 [Salinibacter sp.]|uniref:hypothetical protein n=1 Tax=Salinibacter sp. TaxID=2065818 RepID=UPI002FC2E310